MTRSLSSINRKLRYLHVKDRIYRLLSQTYAFEAPSFEEPPATTSSGLSHTSLTRLSPPIPVRTLPHIHYLPLTPYDALPNIDSRRLFASKPGDAPPAPLPLHTVSLIGRPNVGKSTLYNRLSTTDRAIVFNTPHGHVTRDYKEGEASLLGLPFHLIDTSGLEPTADPGSVLARTLHLTAHRVRSSDLALLLLDARQGITPTDLAVAAWLRTLVDPARVRVLLNKAESEGSSSPSSSPSASSLSRGRADDASAWRVHAVWAEALGLGFGEPVCISAEYGQGLDDLYHLLADAFHARPPVRPVDTTPSVPPRFLQDLRPDQRRDLDGDLGVDVDVDVDVDPGPDPDPPTVGNVTVSSLSSSPAVPAGHRLTRGGSRPTPDVGDDGWNVGWRDRERIKIALVGVPNVGKSTLANAILGYDRSLTGPEPGLTRDDVRDTVIVQGKVIQLIDTAGYVAPEGLRRVAGETTADVGPDGGGKQSGPVPPSDQLSAATSTLSTRQKQRDADLRVARMSVRRSIRGLEESAVVVMLVDARTMLDRSPRPGLSRPELQLLQQAADEGRATVLVANKMDLLTREEHASFLRHVNQALEWRAPSLCGLLVVRLSATTKRGAEHFLPAIMKAYNDWNTRASTAELNALVRAWQTDHAAGHMGNVLGRIRYVAQTAARPPHIVVFCSGGKLLDANQERGLARLFKEGLGLEGTPVRLSIRYRGRGGSQGSHANQARVGTTRRTGREKEMGGKGGDGREAGRRGSRRSGSGGRWA